MGEFLTKKKFENRGDSCNYISTRKLSEIGVYHKRDKYSLPSKKYMG